MRYFNVFLILGLLCFQNTYGQESSDTNSGEMKLVWSDEFDSEHKCLPDPAKWNYDVGGYGWGNNEKQYYTDGSIKNAYVENGVLHIVALKENFEGREYTSARLTTYERKLTQYGRIEVSAKLPKGKGTWPAIWMLPQTIKTEEEGWPLCGEIDIMEHVGKNEGMVHFSLHSLLYNHTTNTHITYSEWFDDVTDTFHVYAIDWTAEYIKYYIDGKLLHSAYKGENGHVTDNEGWPFDKPYYLVLNLAIGGNWGGEIDDNIFPCEMQIDYVRIYQN